MTEPRIIVYTTDFCGFCTAAKRLLERDGIAFEEVNLQSDHQRRVELVQRTGHRTVPIVMLDDELVGGYQELAALRSRGGLDHLKS